jgi:hypothetical protein
MPLGWSTPALVDLPGGGQEIVLNQGRTIVGVDPANGKQLWSCQGFGGDKAGWTTSTPAVQGGVAYVMSAGVGMRPAVIAVRCGGRGDVTKTHVLWRQNSGADTTSPAVSGEYLYWVSGTVNCLRLSDGKVMYRQRLTESRGDYPSPVAADGKLFVATRYDGVYVLAADGKHRLLAHNEFAGDTSAFNASPAVSDGRLYLRSNTYLYCVATKQ